MIQFTWTPSLASVDPDEFRWHDDPEKSRASFALIRSLPDEVLLEIGGKQTGPVLDLVKDRIGPDTNPRWVIGRCLDEAWWRDIISIRNYHYLNVKCS